MQRSFYSGIAHFFSRGEAQLFIGEEMGIELGSSTPKECH